ncbi:MAG: circularly permuted type 2 ATP-grasp protein [Saprospiraceae bacterium]
MQSQQQGTFFDIYKPSEQFYDEVFSMDGTVKPGYQHIFNHFKSLGREAFLKLFEEAKTSFFNQGITFAVYSDTENGTEKIFPFDLFPRIIDAKEWDHIERGVIQRTQAINQFIYDIYHDQKILKDKVVPEALIKSSKNFQKTMMGFEPPGKIYCHISGTDIIRHSDGEYYVLEDNLRCPSGVSYVINNRIALKRGLVSVFNKNKIHSVSDYPEQLLETLQSVKPMNVDEPTCVVFTPGSFNSAYFEHAFLAQRMGIELVEGQDLKVDNDFVYMKTIRGPVKVDVIYRRVDDDFIDPEVFRKDSLLGVPGIMRAYQKGNVTLANAPGTGFADDKAVYTYLPEIIKYYLDEEPLLNNVRTYHCEKEDDYKYVMDNVDKLVVKPVDEAGGYGITIGNQLTKEEVKAVQKRITEDRRKYIAQPIMSLSVHATYIEDSNVFEPRHVDLRTYTLFGDDKCHVLKGGLSRVALKKGNLIVNSSQGGGSKDTWVLRS